MNVVVIHCASSLVQLILMQTNVIAIEIIVFVGVLVICWGISREVVQREEEDTGR